MRAVSPLLVFEGETMTTSYSMQLQRLGHQDSLQAESAFHELRSGAPDHVHEIGMALEGEQDPVVRSYLLALLAESRTDRALSLLKAHLDDVDPTARSWAWYGVNRLTGQVIEESEHVSEEGRSILVVHPVRWRVYTLIGSVTVLLSTIVLFALDFVFDSLGWESRMDVGYMVSRAVMLGIVYGVLGGEVTLHQLDMVVGKAALKGPASIQNPGRKSEIAVGQIDHTRSGYSHWVDRLLGRWCIVGDNGARVEMLEALYQPSDVAHLKRLVANGLAEP